MGFPQYKGKLRMNRSTVTGSGDYGLDAYAGKLIASSITGSCLSPVDAGACVDVRLCEDPRKAVDLICDTSSDCTGATLGYCAGD